MSRLSNVAKELADKNRSTMLKCPIFEIWAMRHLKKNDRYEEYQRAFNHVHKGVSDDEASNRLGSVDENENDPSLRPSDE